MMIIESLVREMKVGYARVSRQIQEEALPQQVERLRRAGAEQILVEIESGTKDTRKEFNRLLDWVKSGKATEIIVTRVDRLGRSVITIARAAKLFEEKGVKLTILDGNVDITSAFGWYSLSQMASLAEFESRLMSQRIKHGKEYERQRGAITRITFGYMKNSEGKPIPSIKIMDCGLSEWEVAYKCKELYVEIGSLRPTANKIHELYGKIFTTPGLRDWLLNPINRGHTVYGVRKHRKEPDKQEVRFNTHPAIITESEFEKIKHLMERAKILWGIKQSNGALNYPLASQVYCGACGSRCYQSKSGKTYHVFRCRKRDEGKYHCSNEKSTSFVLTQETVTNAIIARASEIAEQEAKPNTKEPLELVALRNQLQGIRALGNNPALEAAAQDIENQIIKLEQTAPASKYNQGIIYILTTVFQNPYFYEQLPLQDKITTLRQLVEKVVVLNGAVVSVELKI